MWSNKILRIGCVAAACVLLGALAIHGVSQAAEAGGDPAGQPDLLTDQAPPRSEETDQLLSEEEDQPPPEEDMPPEPAVELTLREESTRHTRYINGFEDGTFQPNKEISRAEAAQMLYKLISAPPADRTAFDDVPAGAWCYNSLGLLAAAGVLDWEGTEIHPDEPLTRAEFVSMVVRLFPEEEPKQGGTFTDVPQDHPYYREVCLARSYKWVSGYGKGQFRPEETVSRAEAVTILNRALGRKADRNYIGGIILPLFSDVSAEYWAYYDIMEASLTHSPDLSTGAEQWTDVNTKPLRRSSGRYYAGLDFYYIDEETGLPVTDTERDGFTYGPDGRYTSGDEEIDRYVKEALSGVITEDMDQEARLRAAYDYTRDTFTYLRRNYYEMGDTTWAAQEAKTMFSTQKGNCYCFTAVFYYLARQLGYDAQVISGKVNNNNPVPHAWVEIPFDGVNYMYDAELEMSYRKKGIYYYDFYHMAYEDVPWRYYR